MAPTKLATSNARNRVPSVSIPGGAACPLYRSLPRWLPVLFVPFLFGCSPAYILKSWSGQRRLMSSRRPIAAVLADASVPESVKSQLRLAQDIRSFAIETMGLHASKSYTSYVELHRPYVTFSVSAAAKTELRPYQWWFPIIGRVPYKGFFWLKDAQAEEEKLRRKGLDVYLRGVTAYSTLGWWSDPLLSSMIGDSTGDLAQTLIHEMTHQTIYFKNDADFNESVATFVGEQGAEDFLRARFGADSQPLKSWKSDLNEEALLDEKWRALYNRLQKLYASPRPEPDRLEERERIFAQAQPELGVEKINNAVVLAYQTYHEGLDDFKAAYERLDRDWPKFVALLKSLDKRRPREALRAWLKNPPARAL